MNTLEARVALDVDAIFTEAKKPRHRKVRFHLVSRKVAVDERWWE